MKKSLKNMMSLLTLSVLVAAVLCFAGCKEKETKAPETTPAVTESESVTASEEATTAEETTTAAETTVDPETVTHTFTFKMKDGETEKEFEISTTETTVGAALLKEGLVEGTVEQYGLYIKVVCGIKHEYTEDGKYWAFYVGDDYAVTGVDTTDIVDGTVYWLKAE